MSAILVRAKIATEIKTLSTREQWPDSAVSQLTILLVRALVLNRSPIIFKNFKIKSKSVKEGTNRRIFSC